MTIEDWLSRADAVLTPETPLRPDRVHHRIRKERDLRLEVRHRRVFDDEFVVLADVGPNGVEGELLIARRLLPAVTWALADVDRFLGGGSGSSRGSGQLSLFT